MNRYSLFAIAVLVALAGCKKQNTASSSNQTNVNACSLITSDEVQKVQNSPVKDTKASENSDTSFRYSQCFYSTEVFSKSVSLAVTQRNSASDKARDPKEFWKETFGRFEGQLQEMKEGDAEKKKSLSEEDDERGGPPKKVEGLGEEAWWTANRMGGALYVLKGDVFIRLSVGGPDDQETKLDKSKALAAKAISRL